MFDGEILGLHRQGFTTGAIALRLGVAPGYVRSVVSADVTGCEVKPHYNARVADEQQYRAARQSARRTRAEEKRARALREIKEAEADLAKLSTLNR